MIRMIVVAAACAALAGIASLTACAAPMPQNVDVCSIPQMQAYFIKNMNAHGGVNGSRVVAVNGLSSGQTFAQNPEMLNGQGSAIINCHGTIATTAGNVGPGVVSLRSDYGTWFGSWKTDADQEAETKRQAEDQAEAAVEAQAAMHDPCNGIKNWLSADEAQLSSAQAYCGGYNNDGSLCYHASIMDLRDKVQAEYAQYTACEQANGA